MADFDDTDLRSQAQRLGALGAVVDTMYQGMGGDFRRGTGVDTKVALRQGRQALARDILARRRRDHERVPDDLTPALKRRYKKLVRFLGPAATPLVPYGMLAHYVRALETLDSLGHMLDLADSHVQRVVMLEGYARQARQVAALAKAINISTHSNVMQLAVIAELRVDGRGSGETTVHASGGDWRQHAMTLEPDDQSDDQSGDEAAP